MISSHAITTPKCQYTSFSCSIPPLRKHQGVGATELSSPRTSAAAAVIATAAEEKSSLDKERTIFLTSNTYAKNRILRNLLTVANIYHRSLAKFHRRNEFIKFQANVFPRKSRYGK